MSQVEWLHGAVGRVAMKEGVNGGLAFQAFSFNGGEVLIPTDCKPYPGEQTEGVLGRPLVQGLRLKGPCVILYLDGADAARFRSMFGLPAPEEIAALTMPGEGSILHP
jgi:hypothetical protein